MDMDGRQLKIMEITIYSSNEEILMKSEHSKSEKKWNALLNWIFPFYACEMLEILKGIAYTSTECRKRKGERNVY